MIVQSRGFHVSQNVNFSSLPAIATHLLIQGEYQKQEKLRTDATQKVVYYLAVAGIFALIAGFVHGTQLFDPQGLFIMRSVSVIACGGFVTVALYQYLQHSERMKMASLVTSLIAIALILAYGAFASGLYFELSPYVTLGLGGGSALALALAGSITHTHYSQKLDLLQFQNNPQLINRKNYAKLLTYRDHGGLNLLQKGVQTGHVDLVFSFTNQNPDLLAFGMPDGTPFLDYALTTNPSSELSKRLFFIAGFYNELTEDHYQLMGGRYSRFFYLLSQENEAAELETLIKDGEILNYCDDLIGHDHVTDFLKNVVFKKDNYLLFPIFFISNRDSLIYAIENDCPDIAHFILDHMDVQKSPPTLEKRVEEKFKKLYSENDWQQVEILWKEKLEQTEGFLKSLDSDSLEHYCTQCQSPQNIRIIKR